MAQPHPPIGFWQQVATLISLTAYRPRRSQTVEAARLPSRSGAYYVLKQPQTRTYLRLSEQDYALWWRMDGSNSIKDLLAYSLRRYRNLPIGHLTRLVQEMRAGHFLQDPPTQVYDQVQQALQKRSPTSRGRRLVNGFFHTEISLDGLDGFFTALYRHTAFLFTWPVQMLLWLIIGWGLFDFGRLILNPAFTVTGQGGWTIPSIILANLIVITIHELGHGLTTKHFGRELHRGGFLIYWGMPAFFVDTSDTWLSPARQRILVSWAGPHTGLIIGGLASLLLTLSGFWAALPPDSALITFLYQMMILAYLSVLVNLNPLLELDGYFILMDWLDMPGLRRRAFRFWRSDLWPKLAETPQPLALWRSLRRSERVFAFYGLLAFVYAFYAVGLVGYFLWRLGLIQFVLDLWRMEALWGQLLVLLLTAVFILPLCYYLLLYVWSYVQAGLDWLARRNLLSRPGVLASLLGLPLLLGLPILLLLLWRLPYGHLWGELLVWLLHLAAAGALLGVARQLPGSRFQWAIWSLTAVPLLLLLVWINQLAGRPLWHDMALLATTGPLLAAALVALMTLRPARLNRREVALIILVGLLGGGTLFLLPQTVGVGMPDSRLAISALTIFITYLALIILAPLLVNFSQSRFALPWLLLAVGIAGLPWLLTAPWLHLPLVALWLYAGLLYLLLGALARFRRFEEPLTHAAAYQERERLLIAFNHFLQAFFAGYETIFGGRRLAAIQAEIAPLLPAPDRIDPAESVLTIGQRCQQVVLLVVDRLDDLAGGPFTQRMGQAAYDSLPWLEAETLARHVLSHLAWGQGLARRFAQTQDERLWLLRQVALFADFEEETLATLVPLLREVTARPGQTIVEEKQPADHFYLVAAGRVRVLRDGGETAVLQQGGYFGAGALLDGGRHEATYLAETAVTLLTIDRHRFDPLLQTNSSLAHHISEGAAERRLLQRMSLFRSLSPQQLDAMEARMERRTYQADEMIARQGQPRTYLYILVEGQVEAVYEDENGRHSLGIMGPGEHFGEYALFADTPYQATYRAVGQAALLLLDEPTFDKLVAGCERMSHYVEQIGSGRLIATRRRVGLVDMLS
jgi:putative peptide zinc metalloprotease protein